MNILATPRECVTHAQMANALRVLAMDAVEKAKSGHPGMPMGMADVATVLFTRFMKFDPADPLWPDRDRFVLSVGHGSMLLYGLLHLLGYPQMTRAEIERFRQLDSRTPGHPEYGHTAGVETTTGPLGQGLATAVGMALAECLQAARYGSDIVDHYTYVIAGDGCLMEGVSQEAIALAGHLKLSKLIVFWDDNGITIDGPIGLADSVDQLKRFEAAGWAAQRIDGHDPEAIAAAIEAARASDRPVMIACKTIIGHGAPTKAGTHGVHGSPLGAQEIAAARAGFSWAHEPFDIPAPIASAWRQVAKTAANHREAWRERYAAMEASARTRFDADLSGRIEPGVHETIKAFKREAADKKTSQATRISSQKVLDILAKAQPNLIGGSADLTGSNNTQALGMEPITPGHYAGRYIHYGIREFGMAAAMNGIALHGGFIPYGGTFLAFCDYSRPAIRLAALMGIRVIHVLTHDSIGLGEDGPTHQPVEHLAALRAIPNLNVFRPADAIETAEAWEIALETTAGPTALCLTRQNLPLLRTEHDGDNRSRRGGYLLHQPERPRDITLFASGSEVALAVAAAERLAADGMAAAVVSMPCLELFAAQPATYRQEILGTAPRIAIEAALRQGWESVLRPEDGFIGMHSFGASAPAADLYIKFGITADAIVEDACGRIAAFAQ